MSLARLSSWFRPPRLTLVLFLVVTGSLSLAMTLVTLQLLSQERDVAARRTEARLDSAANATASTLIRGLDDLALQLASAATGTSQAPATIWGVPLESVRGGGLWVTGDAGSIHAVPGSLRYYPPDALRRSSSPVPPELAAVETLEIRRHDLPQALTAVSALAPTVERDRARALLVRARIYLKLGSFGRALETYDALARIDLPHVDDLPAPVTLAAYGRCLVLQVAGRREALQRESELFLAALDAGRWTLTRAEYENYRDAARGWLNPGEAAPQSRTTDEHDRLADAVSRVWAEWRSRLLAPSGRRLAGDSDGVLILWHTQGTRLALFAATEAFVQSSLIDPARTVLGHSGVLATLVHPDVPTVKTSGARRLLRPAAATGLPWSLDVVDADPAAEAAEVQAHRQLAITGLVGLACFVMAGSAFIVRAVTRELELLRLQTDFVAAVSHEFRTPLTSMAQVSEALLDGRVPPERLAEYYGLQHRENTRLRRLVESILDFGRMESGAREYLFECVNAGGFVTDVGTEFRGHAQRLGYDVMVHVGTGAVTTTLDRAAMGLAVWNLLDNAVKYSPVERTVWLTASATSQGVEISVRDRGIGIPPSDRRRVFDKFTRGSAAQLSGAKGTGLGLAIVRHIVRAHRGAVTVVSAVGEGSTFTIVLPATPVRPSSGAADRG